MAILKLRDKDGNVYEVPAIVGQKGDKGDKGDRGEKGEPFTYDDFTPEQIEELKSGVANADVIRQSQIGRHLEVDEDGKVNVVTTDDAEQDNTKPITASAVYTIVGNIDTLLEII